jgi:ribokinase
VLDVLGRGPILTPNATEVTDLATMLGTDPASAAGGAAQQSAVDLMARTGAPVVVTLGGEGAMVVTPEGQVDRITPPPATVRDTTGAGDTFNGVLAARLAAGEPLEAAVRVAIVAASLSVAHVGARGGMPHAAAIAEALQLA